MCVAVPMDSAGVVAGGVIVAVAASDCLCCTRACGRFRVRFDVVVVAIGSCVLSPGGFRFGGTWTWSGCGNVELAVVCATSLAGLVATAMMLCSCLPAPLSLFGTCSSGKSRDARPMHCLLFPLERLVISFEVVIP